MLKSMNLSVATYQGVKFLIDNSENIDLHSTTERITD